MDRQTDGWTCGWTDQLTEILTDGPMERKTK